MPAREQAGASSERTYLQLRDVTRSVGSACGNPKAWRKRDSVYNADLLGPPIRAKGSAWASQHVRERARHPHARRLAERLHVRRGLFHPRQRTGRRIARLTRASVSCKAGVQSGPARIRIRIRFGSSYGGSSMIVGVPRETFPGGRRVGLVPAVLPTLAK